MRLFFHHRKSIRDLGALVTPASAAVSLVILLCSPLSVQAEWTLLDGARVHPDYHGPVPKKSDVIFSTRFKRDNAANVARAFGATRIEWVYSTDPEFVRSLQSVTPWFGGAVSSTIALPKDEGIAKDFDGRPIVAPWMKSWGAKWITTTDPHTRETLKGVAQRYLELGANSIQVDDPLLQFTAANWGGDFSESSLAGFRTFLSHYADKAELQRAGITDLSGFDYKEFLARQHSIRTTKDYLDRYRALPTTSLWLAYLKETVISHYADFRAFLNAKKGSVVPLSMNLLLFGPDESKPQFDLVPFVDYAMVETKINDLDLVSLQAATYRALGVGYVPSILPLTKGENRTAIAALYAMGAQPLVPWDVYINNGPDEKPSRFFGAAEDYADLYHFVRDNAVYFDGYEELAVAGIVEPVDHYDIKQTATLVKRLSKEKIPYAIFPIGGRKNYSIDSVLASQVRILITANPLTDFTPRQLSSLRSLPVKFIGTETLTDQMLTSLSPYAQLNSHTTRLIPRGTKQGKNIVLHVIRPTERRPESFLHQCEKTIALRGSVFSMNTENVYVAWHTPNRIQKLTAKAIKSGVSIDLPDCEEWGFLELASH